jgi:hypothetical protein
VTVFSILRGRKEWGEWGREGGRGGERKRKKKREERKKDEEGESRWDEGWPFLLRFSFMSLV